MNIIKIKTGIVEIEVREYIYKEYKTYCSEKIQCACCKITEENQFNSKLLYTLGSGILCAVCFQKHVMHFTEPHLRRQCVSCNKHMGWKPSGRDDYGITGGMCNECFVELKKKIKQSKRMLASGGRIKRNGKTHYELKIDKGE